MLGDLIIKHVANTRLRSHATVASRYRHGRRIATAHATVGSALRIRRMDHSLSIRRLDAAIRPSDRRPYIMRQRQSSARPRREHHSSLIGRSSAPEIALNRPTPRSAPRPPPSSPRVFRGRSCVRKQLCYSISSLLTLPLFLLPYNSSLRLAYCSGPSSANRRRPGYGYTQSNHPT